MISVGTKHRCDAPLRAGYVFEYRPGLPIAVVEAKRAYSIPEDDRNTGIERDDLVGFPSPEALWARFREWGGLDDLAGAGLLLPSTGRCATPTGR